MPSTHLQGEPIADLMLTEKDWDGINGALLNLGKCINKQDPAMKDRELGNRLWTELARVIEKNH